jgi:hypothetical protein
MAFAVGARTGVLTLRSPSLQKTSPKRPLYLQSRSRMRKPTPLSLKWILRGAIELVHLLGRADAVLDLAVVLGLVVVTA